MCRYHITARYCSCYHTKVHLTIFTYTWRRKRVVIIDRRREVSNNNYGTWYNLPLQIETIRIYYFVFSIRHFEIILFVTQLYFYFIILFSALYETFKLAFAFVFYFVEIWPPTSTTSIGNWYCTTLNENIPTHVSGSTFIIHCKLRQNFEQQRININISQHWATTIITNEAGFNVNARMVLTLYVACHSAVWLL